jgi:hypothetical protein
MRRSRSFSARSDGRIWLAYAKGTPNSSPLIPSDGGASFHPQSKSPAKEKFMIGMRRGPRILAEG